MFYLHLPVSLSRTLNLCMWRQRKWARQSTSAHALFFHNACRAEWVCGKEMSINFFEKSVTQNKHWCIIFLWVVIEMTRILLVNVNLCENCDNPNDLQMTNWAKLGIRLNSDQLVVKLSMQFAAQIAYCVQHQDIVGSTRYNFYMRNSKKKREFLLSDSKTEKASQNSLRLFLP